MVTNCPCSRIVFAGITVPAARTAPPSEWWRVGLVERWRKQRTTKISQARELETSSALDCFAPSAPRRAPAAAPTGAASAPTAYGPGPVGDLLLSAFRELLGTDGAGKAAGGEGQAGGGDRDVGPHASAATAASNPIVLRLKDIQPYRFVLLSRWMSITFVCA